MIGERTIALVLLGMDQHMPFCLIEKNERMRSWRDCERDFLEMQGHGLAVARGQHDPGAFSRWLRYFDLNQGAMPN